MNMFVKIFLGLLFLLILSDIYIFSVFIQKLTRNNVLRLLWFLPSLLLVIGLIIFYKGNAGSSFREIYMVIFIAIILPKVFFSVVSLLDLPLRYFFSWKVYPFTLLGLVIAISTLFIILYGSIAGYRKLKVTEIDLYSKDLPASFDGYRIAQVSDLHLGNWTNGEPVMKKMVNLINEQDPDIIMVTGDLVNRFATELDGYDEILSGLKATDGVYSVLGNHDYAIYYDWENKNDQIRNLQQLIDRQQAMGWKMLNNKNTLIYRDNDSIALIGVENDGAPPFPSYGNLTEAMKGTENVRFKILLSHDPSHWRREVLDTDIDLMLAGHTHGAQFSLGPLSFATLLYPEWGGMYMENNQALYINTGIGYVAFPFRFGVWPEITVINLRKE